MDRIEKLENILSAATNLSSPSPQPPHRPVMVDCETQTLSTGDIVITKVFFPEGHQPGSQVTRLKEFVLPHLNSHQHRLQYFTN